MPAADLIILGIDSIITLLFYQFYRTSKRAAQKVQDAPDFDITPELRSKLEGAEDQTVPYACIRGAVRPQEEAIPSTHQPGSLGIIQKLLLKEYRTKRGQTGHWSDDSRILRDITKVIPFVIEGASDTNVIVNQPREAEYLLENLNIVYDHFEPSQSSILEKGLDRIFGEVTKGFQETEKLLPVGTKITGVGQLSIEKNVLTLAPPSDGSTYILSSMTKAELVKSLGDKAFIYKVLAGIFGVAGGVILYILFKRYYDEYRTQHEFDNVLTEIRNLRSRDGRNRDSGLVEAADTPGDDDDARYCVVCLMQPREVVLLDCGHICICADCADLLPLPRKCPVCRNSIVRILPIYVS